MFTGIIAEQGKVVSLNTAQDGSSATLMLQGQGIMDGLELGASVAVNGVCLTATMIHGKLFGVDVMGETLVRTTMGALAQGSAVNLERCVPAGGRLDGHVVQGHVDGVGTLIERENHGAWERLRFAIPRELARFVAEKGSIAVDGVSLTVTAVSKATAQDQWFEVGLIPTTLEETTLGATELNADVNLEVDVLAKYTERLLAFRDTPVGVDVQHQGPQDLKSKGDLL